MQEDRYGTLPRAWDSYRSRNGQRDNAGLRNWVSRTTLFTIDLCARRSSSACVEGNGMPVANDREGREFDAWVGVCNAAVWDDIT